MIVVVGQPYLRATGEGAALDGLAARIAVVAAERGRLVQLVGTAGEDDAGDEVVLALARAAVGHAALLRKAGQQTLIRSNAAPETDEGPMDPLSELHEPAPEAASPIDAGDIDLALRYLTDFSVLVLAVPADGEMARVVMTAAGWADARLIVVVPAGSTVPDGLPPDATVFEAPEADPDGVFAAMVGSFVAALDDGGDPGAAFRETVENAGWAPTAAE